MTIPKTNIPIILTLIRLIIAPLLLPLLLVYILPYNIFWINIVLAGIFLLFSITDFFDGYLARKYAQETHLGRMLDPIADKFLFYSVFIALVVVDKLFFVWALLLIGREIFIMGLRLVALEHGFRISVSAWGKLKTVVQTMYVTGAIANPCHSYGIFFAWNIIVNSLLGATLIVSLYSAYMYYRFFMKHINQEVLKC